MAAKEITLPVFERNLKLFNRKGLRRTYTSVVNHWNEYMIIAPLGSSNKYVLECTLDKEFVEEFQTLLKNKGFDILGSKNYYHIGNLVQDYQVHKDDFKEQAEQLEAIEKDYELMLNDNPAYKEIENEDVRFYFLPYAEGIDTLYEFIKVAKGDILAFAKEKDITIMLKVVGFNTQVDGFFGFNFYDADKTDEEVVIYYAARITVAVDFKVVTAPYCAALLMSGIGESLEELSDSDLNVHLVADNLKYEK